MKYKVVGDVFDYAGINYTREERIIYAESVADAILAFDEMMIHGGYTRHHIISVEEV